MTREDKIKKAVAVAVAYHIEQEKADLLLAESKHKTGWNQAGKTIQMNVQRMIQQRGSIAKPRTN
jgi:hypothetical protein